MSSDFDPSKLANNNRPKSPSAERLFVQVESFKTPNDGFHTIEGHVVGKPGEKVSIRLNTVPERLSDRPKLSEAQVQAQYVNGEYHRRSVADIAREGVPFLAFDEARKLGTQDGVTQYRTHWAQTMSTNPGAEIKEGMAHIKLKAPDERNGTRAQAYVELIQKVTPVNKDNIDKVLADAMSIKDDQGNPRNPVAIMRISHQGTQYAAPRLYPETEPVKVFDQASGASKEVPRRVDAEITLGKLMAPQPSAQNKNAITADYQDMFRAVISGLKGKDEPAYASQQSKDNLHNFYLGAKEGALKIDVVAAETIPFGVDSRKTYLNDMDRPHLAVYTIKEPAEGDRVRQSPGYTDTAVAVQRYPDGAPYAVFAAPSAMWPEVRKLAEISSDASPHADQDKTAAKPETTANRPAPPQAPQQAQDQEQQRQREPAAAGYDDGPGM
jgi:hypothetical protein